MTANFNPLAIQGTTCSMTYDGTDCVSCAIEFCQGGGFGNNQFGFQVDCSNIAGGAVESTCGTMDTARPFSVQLHSVYEIENHPSECAAEEAVAQCDRFLAGISEVVPPGIDGCACQDDGVNIACNDCSFTINRQSGVISSSAAVTDTGGSFAACADLEGDDREFCMEATFNPQNILGTTCTASYGGTDCTSCAIQFCQGGGFGRNAFGFSVDCSNTVGGVIESTCDDYDQTDRFSIALHAVYEAENHRLTCDGVEKGQDKSGAHSVHHAMTNYLLGVTALVFGFVLA